MPQRNNVSSWWITYDTVSDVYVLSSIQSSASSTSSGSYIATTTTTTNNNDDDDDENISTARNK